MPMHEEVHSNFHIRRLKSMRRPSFAGNGLPERMRSTAFAFLGLTAALGLALVAIFAQLSFPVLSPAPPPAGPAGESGVSSSLALGQGPGIGTLQPTLLSAAAPAGSGRGEGTAVPTAQGSRPVGHVGSPIPVAPGKAGKPNDGGSVEPSPPPAAPAPTSPSGDDAASAETTPAPAPAPIPASPDPKPVTSTPKPNEEPPAPAEPESKPGKHHEGKPGGGASTPVEKPVKEPKPPKAEVPPAPTPAPPPAPEAPAEKGNGSKGKGKALGHYK